MWPPFFFGLDSIFAQAGLRSPPATAQPPNRSDLHCLQGRIFRPPAAVLRRIREINPQRPKNLRQRVLGALQVRQSGRQMRGPADAVPRYLDISLMQISGQGEHLAGHPEEQRSVALELRPFPLRSDVLHQLMQELHISIGQHLAAHFLCFFHFTASS